MAHDPQDIKRILLCSGKIYYELDKMRDELKRHDVVIIRAEQLYPFAMEELKSMLAPYPDGTPLFYVQEEPANMGAGGRCASGSAPKPLRPPALRRHYRPPSSSPATGSSSSHKREQEQLLMEAFGGA